MDNLCIEFGVDTKREAKIGSHLVEGVRVELVRMCPTLAWHGVLSLKIEMTPTTKRT